MNAVPTDPRVYELMAWSIEQDRPLPRPISDILDAEALGGVVDLMTGDVFDNEQSWLDHLLALTDEAVQP